MNDFFVFDGVSSADCGAYITPKEIDSAPQRDVSRIEVPGRNGSLIIDNGRYKDTRLKYCGIIYDDDKFDEYIRVLRGVILGDAGYKRLEDTFNPDEYRMAYFDGDFSPKVTRLWKKMGKFDLSFTCKPQRYLKIGETSSRIISGSSLFNPSVYPAQPLIKAIGYGRIDIGDFSIQIAENALPFIMIDCERMDAYCDDVNCNNAISLESDFPVLKKGKTEITCDETISWLEIAPRWWIL